MLLSCESEGYPESSVTWQDGHLQRIDPSTTAVSTPEQLFKVTSEIRVPSLDKNNYTCSFTNDGISATFHIPGEYLLSLWAFITCQGKYGDLHKITSGTVTCVSAETLNILLKETGNSVNTSALITSYCCFLLCSVDHQQRHTAYERFSSA